MLCSRVLDGTINRWGRSHKRRAYADKGDLRKITGGEIARIEVPAECFGKVLEHREDIIAGLKALGYLYVTLDLQGFRSGSMDEAFHDRKTP